MEAGEENQKLQTNTALSDRMSLDSFLFVQNTGVEYEEGEEANGPDARYQGLSALDDSPSKTNSTNLHFS